MLLAGAISLQLVSCSPQGDSSPSVQTQKSEAQQTPTSRGIATETLNPNIFVSLAKKVVPSVVNISTTTTVKSPFIQGAPDDVFRKFFEDFFGPGWGFEQWSEEGPPIGPGGPGRRKRTPSNPKNLPKAVSLGTGFIIDSSGLILTNNHVVAGADEIKVTFTENPDEKPTDGEVVGRDPDMDVALIKVKAKREMVPLPMGDSDSLEVGEYVVAVGNPFGQGHSVTHGIISAKERTVPGLGAGLGNYLQTDAPINPGNSGGPLLNLRGEVIGINNAIDARAQGIGFAIPINTVKNTLPQLKSKGAVERGYIGVLVGEMTPELAEQLGVSRDIRAPFVTSVTPGEPADKAGIKPYDIILEVNGKKVSRTSDLIAAITAVPVGEQAELKINREGKDMKLKVKVGKRPVSGAETDKSKKRPEKGAKVPTGMTLETLTPETARSLGIATNTKGVVVQGIEYGSPADRAGIARGDVIVEVDRKPITNVDDFYSVVKARKSYLVRLRKYSPMPGPQDVFAVVVLDLKADAEENE